MASNQTFVDFVVGQIKNAGEITAKKMFGEYGIYADQKIFGFICDNKPCTTTQPGNTIPLNLQDIAFLKQP